MPNYHRWTNKDHTKLREMWERGYKIYEIAEILGVTADALASQCKRLKLPKRPPHQHRRRLRVRKLF